MGTESGENWQLGDRADLEAALEAHGLDRGDVCLVGGTSLAVRGLREADEIELVVHPAERLGPDIDALDESITVSRDSFEVIDIADRELLEDENLHDVTGGFKVVRPEITFSYLKARGRPEDRQDIELLKDYSQQTDDWDWDRYRSTYSEPPDSLLSRGFQSLRSDGVRVTVDKVLGLVVRTVPVVGEIKNRLPVYDRQTLWHALTGIERLLTGAELLNRQFAGERFASMDVVAYWAAIDAFERGDEPAFSLQKLGLDWDDLRSLEPQASEPIRVSRTHKILDAPECAWLLHDDHDEFEVEITLGQREHRDDDWLRRQGFDATEIAHLHERKGELLERTGGLFYAILWPPANEYFDEMERTLGNKVSIYERVDIEIDDIERFVWDIYDAQAHEVPEWSIDWKADRMTDFPGRIRLLKILLPNPRFHDGISAEMEMVKNDVRHEFVDHFPDEFYLSLIHATDNYRDNRATKAVIESHR